MGGQRAGVVKRSLLEEAERRCKLGGGRRFAGCWGCQCRRYTGITASLGSVNDSFDDAMAKVGSAQSKSSCSTDRSNGHDKGLRCPENRGNTRFRRVKYAVAERNRTIVPTPGVA